MAPDEGKPVTATVSLLGRDRTGVVAHVTQFLFQRGANIESLEELVQRGVFHMSLAASWSRAALRGDRRRDIENGLLALGRQLGMETRVRFHEGRRRPRMALFVTKEPHCLDALVKAANGKKLPADPVVVIANRPNLRSHAAKGRLPFYHIPWNEPAKAEKRLLKVLDEHDVDFLVLARFMKILSPDFCWRYRNRILNIHPSLLPAFPGATAYRQAWERGVRVVGATAHFVTPNLDEGPIVHQDAFKVRAEESLESIKARGRALEAKVLLQAVKLYVTKRLDVHWGRVWNA